MLLGSFVHLFLGEMSLEYLFLLLSGFWCEGFSDLTLLLFLYLLELKGHLTFVSLSLSKDCIEC